MSMDGSYILCRIGLENTMTVEIRYQFNIR